MYCSKCGQKNDKESKFCSKCGNNFIDNSTNLSDDKLLNKIKVISIISIILSIFFPLVGIVLAIIGLVYNSKYKKENDKYPKYFIVCIISLVISFIMIMILVITTLLVLTYKLKYTNDFVGNWECTSNYSKNSYLSVEFKRDRTYSLVNLSRIYSSTGTYTYTLKNAEDGKYFDIKLNVDNDSLYGNSGASLYNYINLSMSVLDDRAVMNYGNEIYYCEKED